MTLDERIGRYIAKCPPAVSGSDGHGTTFRVAVALVYGFALDADTALRWMLVYNASCMPPWRTRELRHKVAEAEKVSHQKPRGHLLGTVHAIGAGAIGTAPKFIPVRLKPREGRFRTVRTVVLNPYVMGARTHTSETGGGKEASEPSEGVLPSVEAGSLEWPALVPVPGCKVGRPPEVAMADEDWQNLDASGFASEPLVQMAAWMFGPDCTVVVAGRAMP